MPIYYVPLPVLGIVAIMMGYATVTFLLMRLCDRIFGESTTRMKGIRIAQAMALLKSEGYAITPPGDDKADPWDRAVEALRSLAELGHDWDGMGADALSPEIVNTALNYLMVLRMKGFTAPGRICATPAGTVMFEWHEDSLYREAEVVSATEVEWMTIDKVGVAEHGSVPAEDDGDK